ncbi:MAG: phosphotriesterase-related protein [Burkholderiales bacterium]|nr:phosphotriesterase-related protein [Anaerolineae bacterium]
MAIIRTVLGDIAPEELGICYPHEHLLGQPPSAYYEADFVLDDEDAAIRELKLFYEVGGRSVVEMSPPDYMRDAAGMKRVSAASGVHVIATSGYLKEKFSASFINDLSIEQLTEQFVCEVTEGMDGTDVRAGVIKAASSLDKITPNEERLFKAAAAAHHATGTPISTHTEAGTMALEQVELLRVEGVQPQHVIIGHMDRKLDWDYHLQVAQTGVYMGIDQIAKAKYYPDQLRAEFVARLIQAGYGSQILLAGDTARRSGWAAYGGKPGFTNILTNFVPLLKANGVNEDTIKLLLIDNPARVLAFTPKM